ncbi:hypothetical protein DMN91_007479 [Ooceraea biroi]|uniref:FCH domain only protein n=1 Tax=Ooceraea biroi TaxID=2015173 RepID=A0A3L8DK90_OOCBI|nr:hypothetical protein DMN91_007479 [Ooceraea biroi]
MTVDFVDYFWGEKNNGFDVLYHNMKHGVIASKELAEFLREKSAIEENNYKLLSKVAKQASSSTQGTFAPVWAALRGAAEKLAVLHLQMAQRVTELIKDVSKYADELHKKHKAVKEEESSTLEVVQSIQSITVTLHKTKDTCMQKGLELEKLRKDNASPRELEKAEVKFKKSQDDYKALVDKYTAIRNDFEAKMTQACREFLNTYADVLQTNHEQVGQVHIDFKRQCVDMTVEKLLEQFVQSKYTGFEKPGVIEYEEVMMSLAEITGHSQPEGGTEAPKETSKGTNGETGVAVNCLLTCSGCAYYGSSTLHSFRTTVEDKDDSRKSETPTPEVDEDGFCIRPKPDPWENEKGFYSSSDTDSEDERERKIRVEIKPLSNGGAPMSANGDLFSEVGDITPALPPKQSASSTPTGSIVIPRPPSRRGEGPSPRGRMSPATISRADSVASLEFRTAGVGVGSSRGPSPLTIGLADTIPLAVAFHEIVHSYFRGTDETRCQVKLSGDMMLSFPAGIVAVLANNPNPAKLTFRVRNTNRLERLLPNSQLISMDATQTTVDSTIFEFNMSALTTLLRRQAEQNPSASYFNVDILKYQIKCKDGAGSCPFQLVAYWKCETTHTDLKIDYKYNSRAMASASPLLNLHVAAPIDGGFKSFNSKPSAQWLPETNRVLWKFTELSQHSEGNGVGSLKARVELERGPGSQGTIFTQFNCEGTTLSGVEFELIGSGYRLSLVKRKFVSGMLIIR